MKDQKPTIQFYNPFFKEVRSLTLIPYPNKIVKQDHNLKFYDIVPPEKIDPSSQMIRKNLKNNVVPTLSYDQVFRKSPGYDQSHVNLGLLIGKLIKSTPLLITVIAPFCPQKYYWSVLSSWLNWPKTKLIDKLKKDYKRMLMISTPTVSQINEMGYQYYDGF